MEILDVAVVCVGLLSLGALVFGVVKFRRVRRAERAREEAHLIVWLAEQDSTAKVAESVEVVVGHGPDAVLASTPPLLGLVMGGSTGLAPEGAGAALLAGPNEAPNAEGEGAVVASVPQRTLADDIANFFGDSIPFSPAENPPSAGDAQPGQ